MSKDRDLNDSVGGSTTVEELAKILHAEFAAVVPQVASVKVQEDDDRWGRFSQ